MDRFLDWMERNHIAVTISVILFLVVVFTTTLISVS